MRGGRRSNVSGVDQYTKLMLHCNGDDGSTSFPDSSLSAHVVTAHGDAQVDTAQRKFGTGSALFDGTGDYFSVPDSVDFDLGLDSFTIDAWCRWNSTSSIRIIVEQFTSGSIGWTLYSWGTLQFVVYLDGGSINLTGSAVPSSTWQHVAAVRSGSVWTLYQDGVATASNTSSLMVLPRVTDLRIGCRTGDSYFFDGWIDELRLSKGIARWVSNFTLPNSEYSSLTPQRPDVVLLDVVPLNVQSYRL
jgi:hypothetical protein